MAPKGDFLQIRVSARQKEQIRRNAKAAGMDLSAYVLARAIPQARIQFTDIVAALKRGRAESFQLAALNDLLNSLSAREFDDAVATADLQGLTPFHANYVAAMVELSAHVKGVTAPAWTRNVDALETPWYASTLSSLRAHLLHSSPVPFKRRNIFIDSSVGDRV